MFSPREDPDFESSLPYEMQFFNDSIRAKNNRKRYVGGFLVTHIAALPSIHPPPHRDCFALATAPLTHDRPFPIRLSAPRLSSKHKTSFLDDGRWAIRQHYNVQLPLPSDAPTNQSSAALPAPIGDHSSGMLASFWQHHRRDRSSSGNQLLLGKRADEAAGTLTKEAALRTYTYAVFPRMRPELLAAIPARPLHQLVSSPIEEFFRAKGQSAAALRRRISTRAAASDLPPPIARGESRSASRNTASKEGAAGPASEMIRGRSFSSDKRKKQGGRRRAGTGGNSSHATSASGRNLRSVSRPGSEHSLGTPDRSIAMSSISALNRVREDWMKQN